MTQVDDIEAPVYEDEQPSTQLIVTGEIVAISTIEKFISCVFCNSKVKELTSLVGQLMHQFKVWL